MAPRRTCSLDVAGLVNGIPGREFVAIAEECLMAIALGVLGNLATKKPVRDNEVHHCEQDAEAPPDNPDVQGVCPSKGESDGDVLAAADRRKQCRKEADGGAGQHGCEIETRTKESSALSPFADR